MAEIDKVLETAEENPQEGVDIEIDTGEPQTPVEAALDIEKEFYKNIAEDLSDEVLGRISKELVDEYKKDKISRKDWETSYTSGLDLLGFKYEERSRPFRGASAVTHPVLSEAAVQFQSQAYKELLPAN